VNSATASPDRWMLSDVSGATLFQAESQVCSNQIWISATPRCSGVPKQIAVQSTRRSGWRRPRGRKLASSTGGSKSVSSGSAGCEARTTVNGGLELLIFVRPGRERIDRSPCWRQVVNT
jgi:hypothetical protein